jgi:hypothetical protein
MKEDTICLTWLLVLVWPDPVTQISMTCGITWRRASVITQHLLLSMVMLSYLVVG